MMCVLPKHRGGWLCPWHGLLCLIGGEGGSGLIFLELSQGCKSSWAKVHLRVLGSPVSLRKGQLDCGSLASPDEDCLLLLLLIPYGQPAAPEKPENTE